MNDRAAKIARRVWLVYASITTLWLGFILGTSPGHTGLGNAFFACQVLGFPCVDLVTMVAQFTVLGDWIEHLRSASHLPSGVFDVGLLWLLMCFLNGGVLYVLTKRIAGRIIRRRLSAGGSERSGQV